MSHAVAAGTGREPATEATAPGPPLPTPGLPLDASIIVGSPLAAGLLGYWQERRAPVAVEELLALIRTTAGVRTAPTAHAIAC